MFGIFGIESKTRRYVCLALILLSGAWRRRKCFMLTDVFIFYFFFYPSWFLAVCNKLLGVNREYSIFSIWLCALFRCLVESGFQFVAKLP